MVFGLKFRPQAKITKKPSDKAPAKADGFGLKFRPQAKINKEAFG